MKVDIVNIFSLDSALPRTGDDRGKLTFASSVKIVSKISSGSFSMADSFNLDRELVEY